MIDAPGAGLRPPPPPERVLLPFAPGSFRMAMRLVGVRSEDLVEIDDKYFDEMAERRHLLATRRAEVFAATRGSEAAAADILSALVALLTRRHPDWFELDGASLVNRLTSEQWDLAHPSCDPLELAGRLVQEDLCIIDTATGEPVLSAAVLCAPSRWRLAEKIGRPLAAVHEPVPLYAERLARPVDRFMVSLRPGKLVERMNWSVVDDGALFQLGGKHRSQLDATITPDNVPDRLFLRVERQTLMRLAPSGSVLFAIRVHSYPLSRILEIPGAAADLQGALRALPESVARYKSLPAFREALLARLERARDSAAL